MDKIGCAIPEVNRLHMNVYLTDGVGSTTDNFRQVYPTLPPFSPLSIIEGID